MMKGCTAVVHIATAIPRDASAMAVQDAWDMTARLRIEGTQVLLHAALTAGVQRYIQQSIVQIYPDGGSHWLDESTPLDLAPERAMICGPIIKMEEIVRANAPEQLQWCILRGGYFVGPGTLQDYQIALLRAERCTIPGDGSEHLSLINVRDMATAITAALAAAPAGSTFNIVDEPVYHSDYIDHIADLLKVPHARRDTRQPRPPSHRCNNKAAREALGWRPVYGIWPTAEQITTQ
jgi:nucleoside-diphosphate-sugar epimerase